MLAVTVGPDHLHQFLVLLLHMQVEAAAVAIKLASKAQAARVAAVLAGVLEAELTVRLIQVEVEVDMFKEAEQAVPAL
jgi:hypothetical protein